MPLPSPQLLSTHLVPNTHSGAVYLQTVSRCIITSSCKVTTPQAKYSDSFCEHDAFKHDGISCYCPRAPEVFYIETMKSFSILTTILVWYAKVNTFNLLYAASCSD